MKRVYKWDDESAPNFDFVEGCASGYVVWWNEEEYCIDTTKKPRETGNEHNLSLWTLNLVCSVLHERARRLEDGHT